MKPVVAKAKTFFDSRSGEVTDMELSSEFPDDDIHELFLNGIIIPGDHGAVWYWVTAPSAD